MTPVISTIKKSVLLKCATYIEQSLAPIFQKENWAVFPLEKDKVSDGEALRQIFSVRHFNLIVYDLREKLGTQSVACLEQFLQLASAKPSDKILFLSGAEVLDKTVKEAVEATPIGPFKPEGQILARLEALALSWKRQGLPITILRFPDIYGPGMGREDGFLARYLYDCVEHKPLPVYSPDEQRDFLSVQDTAYAVFQAAERGYTADYLHIASGHPVTYRAFYQMVKAVLSQNIDINYHKHGTFAQAILSPELAKRQIGWRARHHLADSLPVLYKDIAQAVLREKQSRQSANRKERYKRLKNRMIPYAENIAGALAMMGIVHLQGGHLVNSVVPFDFNFIYIAVMGLLYGRRQAFLAVGFSYLILLAAYFSNLGFGLIAILYQPEELLHFLSYLAIGVITGYTNEQAKFREEADRWSHEHDQERYRFLCHLFEANVKIKDKMYRQIVNSQDSLGRIYRIVSSLDSVEPEHVYNKTALVTAEILDVSQVIIYTVGQNQAYLRQKVRIGDMTEHEPHSLRIEDYPYLQQMMKDHHIFVNRDLLKGIPDLAAPIVYEGHVIAVIQIYQMDFDQWSVFQLNLMAVTSRLVAASLARAYAWEQEMMKRRYIPGTRILKETEFSHVIEKFRERHQMQMGYSVMLAKIALPGLTYEQIDQRIGRQIRAEDYIGILHDAVWILFPDADRNILSLIQQRLAKGGVPITDSEEII